MRLNYYFKVKLYILNLNLEEIDLALIMIHHHAREIQR